MSSSLDRSFQVQDAAIIIKEFLATYVKNAGCTGVVIGLSGGIDSAVTAVLSKKALGKKQTHCLFLPDKTTPPKDHDHCKLLVKTFDFFCTTVDISTLVDQCSEFVPSNLNKYGLANLKARIRMMILFSYANMNNLLVCGTSNKSELLVGYFTKYGDGGVDIQPLGDLYKTQVWELARYLKIPAPLINKPPTAGLWYHQTDEGELGLKYTTLDQILIGLEQKRALKDIATQANVAFAEVKRIKQMRIKSQHKRRSPLIPKIGLRTPGLDWRSPVQEG